MKRFRNFIAKHNEEISLGGILSFILVSESSLLDILKFSLIPTIILVIGYWGKRINDRRKNKEL